MHVISEHNLIEGITERHFTVGDIPGILWTPPVACSYTPVPIILMGQPGGIGMRRTYSRVAARARSFAAHGFAAATIERLILPLVDEAVPEWQTTLDELLGLPEIGERVGFSGGVIAIGTRLAALDPRIVAAGLFAGSYVPRATMDEAGQVTIPLHILLQWDDEGNDRHMALDLFDAFGSTEKSLYANMGGHTGVPGFAGDDAIRFFVRHLGAVVGGERTP